MTQDATGDLLKQRAAHWGDPSLTHARIAEVWSGILDHEVTAHEVALCMTGLKLVRATLNPDNPDSLDDAEGYVRIGKLIMRGDESFEQLMGRVGDNDPVPFEPVEP